MLFGKDIVLFYIIIVSSFVVQSMECSLQQYTTSFIEFYINKHGWRSGTFETSQLHWLNWYDEKEKNSRNCIPYKTPTL